MKYPHRRPRQAAVLTVACLLALPLAAEAVHWPNFGGDAGHSGNQPVAAAQMAVQFAYRHTDPGSIRTSVVTSGGAAPADQRVAYGKFVPIPNDEDDETRIHILQLDTGTEKVPADDQVIDDDTDGDGAGADSDDRALGTGSNFVTPVSSSADGASGQLYVVHNDEDSDAAEEATCEGVPSSPNPASSDNDIAIAQFDEATGEQKTDVAIGRAFGGPSPVCTPRAQVTDGYVIESSPVLGPADNAGNRRLYFVARYEGSAAGQTHRLFSVAIGNAGAANATIGATVPQFRNIPNLNTKASPTIAFLRDPATGFVRPYVVVAINAAATASDIRAFQGSDLGEDEVDLEVPVDIPGNPQTVSVPVTAGGGVPGHDTSAPKAPALYAAYHNAGPTDSPDDDTTTVHRFTQTGSNEQLTDTVVSPPALDGAPGPALAVSTIASGDTESGGSVIVSTGENLFVLNPTTLAPYDQLLDAGEGTFQPGLSGFARNAPSTSGGFVFLQGDGGIPYVLSLQTAERVSQADFTPHEDHLEADFAFGQPAYSNGYLQFLNDNGLFVYRTGVVAPPNAAPTASFTATPNPALVNEQITFDASGSTDPEKAPLRYEWDFDNNGTFEVDRGNDPRVTASFPAVGSFDVTLRVTDDRGASHTVTKNVVITAPPNRPPVASFTATPNPAQTGQLVTFDATTSTDPDGPISRYEWDLDGNGSYETNTGNVPRATQTYSVNGVRTVRLRVVDPAGAANETSRQLTVNRRAGGSCAITRCRPTLSSRVRPSRDTKLPLRFTVTGRVGLPSGLTRADGCRGRVAVQYKAGRKTISNRRARVRSNCTYRLTTSFRDRSRIGNRSSLRVVVRFQGNSFLTPRSARTRRARVR